VWNLLNTLVCPPLAPEVLEAARVLCDKAGRDVAAAERDGKALPVLVDRLIALDACWHLLRGSLGVEHWRRLRADLRRQRRSLARRVWRRNWLHLGRGGWRKPGGGRGGAPAAPLQRAVARRLCRHLRRQRRLLGRLHASMPGEPELLIALERLRRKARRCPGRPQRDRARRRVTRFTAAMELLCGCPGLTDCRAPVGQLLAESSRAFAERVAWERWQCAVRQSGLRP
jgi:hypothetical protein